MDEENVDNQQINNGIGNIDPNYKLGGITGKGFMPGKSGNPLGRPKGQTLKEWRRQKLAEMSDNERLEFLKTVTHIDQWKMAEGNPENKTDITTKGEKLDLDLNKIEAFDQWYKSKNKTKE